MTNCLPADLPECRWNKALWSSVPVALLVIGTFGNILNIAVLSRKKMRRSSISVYLLCLSGADLSFLWWGMVPRMIQQGYHRDIKSESEFLCKMISWAPATSAAYSIWILALMTLERVLLTCWPLAARAKLTRKTSLIAVTTTFFLICLLTIHVPFSAEIKTVMNRGDDGAVLGTEKVCTYASTAGAMFYLQHWPFIVLTVLNLMPMTVVVFGNAAILLTIITGRRNLRRTGPTEVHNDHHMSSKRVKSATKMVFLVSSVLILTTSPFTFGNAILSLSAPSSVQETARRHLVYTVLRHLMYCNFTFNFVLYFVSGTLFKQEWNTIVHNFRIKISKFLAPRQPEDRQNIQTLSTNPPF